MKIPVCYKLFWIIIRFILTHILCHLQCIEHGNRIFRLPGSKLFNIDFVFRSVEEGDKEMSEVNPACWLENVQPADQKINSAPLTKTFITIHITNLPSTNPQITNGLSFLQRYKLIKDFKYFEYINKTVESSDDTALLTECLM